MNAMKPEQPEPKLKSDVNCVIYARCSTRDQETENQLAQLRRYADKQGWAVTEEIIDVRSGGKGVSERAGLEKVFALAHRHTFDVLIFWSLDRLSREGSRKTIAYLSELDDCKVDWHSYTEPYISSLGIFKDAIIALLATLAKQERIRISERVRAGLERVKREGKRLGRPRTAATRVSQAKELREQGLSFGAIGKAMGITRARAFQLCKMV